LITSSLAEAVLPVAMKTTESRSRASSSSVNRVVKFRSLRSELNRVSERTSPTFAGPASRLARKFATLTRPPPLYRTSTMTSRTPASAKYAKASANATKAGTMKVLNSR
jgi:hypothetical protein